MNFCDHNHDTRAEIRALPLGGGAHLNVCAYHWEHELNYRRKALKATLPEDLPKWESLQVVSEAIPKPIPTDP